MLKTKEDAFIAGEGVLVSTMLACPTEVFLRQNGMICHKWLRVVSTDGSPIFMVAELDVQSI